MNIPQSLQIIADIGIAFAGFSGLIVAFRRNAGPLTNVQISPADPTITGFWCHVPVVTARIAAQIWCSKEQFVATGQYYSYALYGSVSNLVDNGITTDKGFCFGDLQLVCLFENGWRPCCRRAFAASRIFFST